jgi:superfamily I DNA/RNA helicase
MIVAGAGSGKTKVLTTRIAHLMRNGVDAFNILSLTFTNKAAREMKDRVEKILGGSEARNCTSVPFTPYLPACYAQKRTGSAIRTTLPYTILMMQKASSKQLSTS